MRYWCVAFLPSQRSELSEQIWKKSHMMHRWGVAFLLPQRSELQEQICRQSCRMRYWGAACSPPQRSELQEQVCRQSCRMYCHWTIFEAWFWGGKWSSKWKQDCVTCSNFPWRVSIYLWMVFGCCGGGLLLRWWLVAGGSHHHQPWALPLGSAFFVNEVCLEMNRFWVSRIGGLDLYWLLMKCDWKWAVQREWIWRSGSVWFCYWNVIGYEQVQGQWFRRLGFV